MTKAVGNFKICNKCKIERNVSAFCREKTCLDGYHTICKECMNPGWERRMKLKQEKITLLESGFKKCTKCKQVKTIDNFWKTGPTGRTLDGKTIYCKECYRKIKQAPHLKQTHRKSNTSRRIRLRDEVFQVYGGYKCQCPGGCSVIAKTQVDKSFFTLDHINNDGAAQRKQGLKNTVFYKWLKDNNFPLIIQVLCWNCNLSKQINHGKCAHELNQEEREI